jgi:uncharacterized protein (DUF1330 family)
MMKHEAEARARHSIKCLGQPVWRHGGGPKNKSAQPASRLVIIDFPSLKNLDQLFVETI